MGAAMTTLLEVTSFVNHEDQVLVVLRDVTVELELAKVKLSLEAEGLT